MKIDRKSSIVGLILGLALGAGIIYADTVYNYNIGIKILIPDEVSFTVSIPKDMYGNYYLPDLKVIGTKATATFSIANTGTANLTISYEVTSDDPNLAISLEAYQSHSSEGNKFKDGNTATLPRSNSWDLRLIAEDLGAETGEHTATLSIEVKG